MEPQKAYHFRRNGKIALRNAKGAAYGVMLTVAVISYLLRLVMNEIVSLVQFTGLNVVDPTSWMLFADKMEHMRDIEIVRWSLDLALQMFSVLIPLGLAIAAMKVLVSLFVKSPVRLGQARWFSRNREIPYAPQYSLLFSLFKGGSYMPGVRGMFWKKLKLFLWSLPQRVVGIVFAYGVYTEVKNLANVFRDVDSLSGLPRSLTEELINSGMVMGYVMIFIVVFSIMWQILMIVQRLRYHFVDWLLADQPELAPKRAIELSIEMGQGLKWEIAKIYLFYFLFHVLVTPLIIVSLFLRPLINAKREAALAEVYAYARDNMVAAGRLSMEELGYRKQPEEQPPKTEYFTVGRLSDTPQTPPVQGQDPAAGSTDLTDDLNHKEEEN